MHHQLVWTAAFLSLCLLVFPSTVPHAKIVRNLRKGDNTCSEVRKKVLENGYATLRNIKSIKINYEVLHAPGPLKVAPCSEMKGSSGTLKSSKYFCTSCCTRNSLITFDARTNRNTLLNTASRFEVHNSQSFTNNLECTLQIRPLSDLSEPCKVYPPCIEFLHEYILKSRLNINVQIWKQFWQWIQRKLSCTNRN